MQARGLRGVMGETGSSGGHEKGRASRDLICALVPGRRGEILDAALEIFEEKGYENGRMCDIAARVGVTEPALYRYFSNKEDMFLALIEVSGTVLEQFFGMIDRIDVAPAAALRDLFEARASLRSEIGPALRTVFFAAAVGKPQFVQAYRERVILPALNKLVEMFGRVDRELGIERPPQQLVFLSHTVISLALGTSLLAQLLESERDSEPDYMAEEIVRMLGWDREC